MGSTIKVYSLLITHNFPGQLLWDLLILCIMQLSSFSGPCRVTLTRLSSFNNQQTDCVMKQQYVYVVSYNMHIYSISYNNYVAMQLSCL